MPHSAERHSQVRALAHRLANGKMSWADYREQRHATVELLVSGAEEIEYAKPVVFEDTTLPKEHELSRVYIDVDELEREPKRWPAFLAVGALGLVIGAAAWVLWQSTRPPVIAEAPVVVMSGAEAALAEFLEADDWSAPALGALQERWTGFSDLQRTEARRSMTWREMQGDLRDRLNQQKVLATVDESGEAQAQLERLERLRNELQR